MATSRPLGLAAACSDAAHHATPSALPAGLFTAIDHVGVAVPDSTRRSTSTSASSACASCTRRSTRSRACARRCSPSATRAPASSCSRRSRRTRRSRSSSTAPARGCSRWPTGSTTSTPSARRCASAGVRLLYDEPRRGTAGSRINFVHPKDAGGVLVELVEPAASTPSLRLPAPGYAAGTRQVPLPAPARAPSAQEAPVQHILDAILGRGHRPRTGRPAGARGYRGVTVHADEVGMFEGRPTAEKDPRKPARRGGADPELGPGEALVAVMASADQLQHRLVLDLRAGVDVRLPASATAGSAADQAPRPALPRARLATCPASCCAPGPGVNAWKPGDEVVAHCLSVELEHRTVTTTRCSTREQRIWGFETNFGGLASSPWSRPTSSCRSRRT